MLFQLADLIEENVNEIATLESLDNGKPFNQSYGQTLGSAAFLRSLAGYADKIQGHTIPTGTSKFHA